MMDQPRDLQNDTDHLVVIGASAGGIEALQTLAASLSPEFPAPIVVAQHLSPSRESALGEILAKASRLRVRSISDRERLEPGTIYVVPSNSYVEIVDRDIVVRLDNGQPPLPSIDLLFTTAASVFGERTIGVVLTGTGTDGAAGARDIKAAGGTIVIQNPETASFPSLPLALPPTIVDVVADLETIGARLADLLSGDRPGQTPQEDAQLRALLAHLRERTGIDFNAYKPPTIRRRLQRRMTSNDVSTLAEYTEFLQHNPDEYPRLANAFLIKVTEFFRDPDLFDHLREQVLPDVLRTAREHGELRIWSAGCATGEEAYSLAMLLSEELTEADRGISVRVFATDLDADAVSFARRGIFPASALASMPSEMIERYFVRADHAYEVKKEIRSMVVFGQHDLAQRAPFPRIDITLCRNVLIYFTAELQKRALHLFAFSLRDDGYLILGKAESVHPLPEYFTSDHPRLRIYRRIGGRIPVPIGQVRGATTVSASPSSPIRPLSALSSHIPRTPSEHPARLDSARADAILARLPVGVVVVDRKYDVQSINAAARRLLGVYGPALGEDLIHQTRHVPSNVLRTVVDAAFRGELTTSLFDVASDVTAAGEPMALQLVSYPESSQQPDEVIEAATIIITDVTLHKTERHTREERESQVEKELARLNQRVEQLTHANRVLLDANEELAAINAETRIANEVLLVDSEEIQSATEEVETLNEELQATNEELETLNEELQATVEELNTTNDDLHARSLELQELAVSLESQRIESDAQRDRVQAILNNMSDAVLVVDRNAEPLMTNAAFRTMFGDHGELLQPRVGDNLLETDQSLQRRIANGEVFTIEFTVMSGVPGEQPQRWFEATGQPVEGGRGDQSGVIVIRDITDRSLRRMQDEFLAIASHELRSPLTTLSGNIQLLQRVLGQHDDQRVRRYVETARSQSQRLTRLVEDLVDAVRLQTGRFELVFEEFDLVELARECVSAAQIASLDVPIELDASDETIMIVGDQVRIEQVLMSLLSNAIAHARGTERIDVRVRRLDDHVEMQVQDYGVGIASGDHERIFSRFSQVELVENTRPTEAGLGLGLFISRSIVLSHGGTIKVESAPGEGATFTVVLPARQKDDGSA